MANALSEFLISATAIIVAGSFLTHFADAIAAITGLGRLVIGGVLLAGATSLPELAVDVSAIRQGMADLAVGDLMGSSLMNLLILAMLDLSHRSHGRMLSRQAAAHALAGLVSTSLATIVAIGLLTGKALAPYSIAGLSPGVIAVGIVYALGTRLVYLDQRLAAGQERLEAPATPPMTLRNAVLGFTTCAGIILLAGPRLAGAAGELADRSGLGNTFVGTTLVALATSLPELVSMLAALRIGAVDLAIGNVFGSNAFNMILLVPLDLVQPGSLLAVVSSQHVISCMATVLATQIAVIGQLYHVERRTHFIEPDAWLVILVVSGALAMIFYFS